MSGKCEAMAEESLSVACDESLEREGHARIRGLKCSAKNKFKISSETVMRLTKLQKYVAVVCRRFEISSKARANIVLWM